MKLHGTRSRCRFPGNRTTSCPLGPNAIGAPSWWQALAGPLRITVWFCNASGKIRDRDVEANRPAGQADAVLDRVLVDNVGEPLILRSWYRW